jgi:hypothetical protein
VYQRFLTVVLNRWLYTKQKSIKQIGNQCSPKIMRSNTDFGGPKESIQEPK